MSCYVDPLFVFPSREPHAFRTGKKYGHQWSHLWADSPAELHSMAAAIGMRREWFQDKPGFPHYDLVPPRREQALFLGAIEMRLSDWKRKVRLEQEALR